MGSVRSMCVGYVRFVHGTWCVRNLYVWCGVYEVCGEHFTVCVVYGVCVCGVGVGCVNLVCGV